MSDADKKKRYKLGEALGRGGQGHTFRATDSTTGAAVAVKRLRLKGSEGWKPFDLFERECKVLAALSHSGIPTFLDSFADEDEGEFFLVMELVEGRPLGQMLRRGGPVERSQLWNILHQALEILTYLHGLSPPVIHRDVKPSNLVLNEEGRLYLVDFGGVRVALREDGGSTVVGTFGFMAPEQLHGEATPATDIYGLGATLATLATGVEADKLPRKGLKVDLDRLMPEDPLRELLRLMLEPDPDDRPGSCAKVLEEARRLQRGAPAKAATPPSQPTPPAQGEVTEEDSPLRDVPAPLMFVLQVVGAMGYVGLVLLDAIFLPVVFAMLGAASSDKSKQKELQEKQKAARKALGRGRRTLKALAQGTNPYKSGGDGGPPDRRLPRGPRPPRHLPPGRGKRRGRRR